MEQGLAIVRKSKNHFVESQALTFLSLAYIDISEYPKAIDFAKQSLAIAQEIKNQVAEISPLLSLGITYSSLGDYQQAISLPT
ncbi:MAG: tetratricopeptide repeat protein [Rhizonema sp. PD38]|nr:tetratricopeptide repeat protein [Rhizonema sp. PD38]